MLVAVENKKTLNVKNANGEISCLTWVQEKIIPKVKDILNLKDEDHNDYMKYIVSIFMKMIVAHSVFLIKIFLCFIICKMCKKIKCFLSST